jgi:transposase InsO family protein
LNSGDTQIHRPGLIPIPPAGIPFSRWGIDFVQDLPETEEGMTNVFTAVNYATRWVIAVATKDRSAATVGRVLYENIVCSFGAPIELISDRGSCFLADGITAMNEMLKVKHFASTSYHPQTNGMVERMHRDLKRALTTLTASQPIIWDRYLAQAVFALRARRHTVTGESPFFLCFGMEPRIPGESLQEYQDT